MRIQTIRLPDAKEGLRYLSDLVYTLTRVLTDIATQLNSLSEGRITAATNADTAPPTTGDHQLGDYVRNTNPTVASDGSVLLGWVCTAAGTPGMWKEDRSQTGGALAGFRNLFINASGAINQRGYVSGTATTGANQYTLDRWRVVVAGQNLTYAASGNGYILTAPAGGLEQVFEGRNIAGGTYTLSWTGTATATVNGTAVANGGQFTLPANTNATARFIGGTVEKPQLELGEQSPFEIRQIGVEMPLCRRYFRPLYGQAGTFLSATAATVVVDMSGNPMRTAPTVIIANGTGILLDPGVAFRNVAGVLVNAVSAEGGYMDLSTSGATAGKMAILVNGGMALSAEL